MKLIKPSYNIIEQKSGLEGIYEIIETAGRLCYKSERPEGKTSKEFVDKLINMKHYSVLEHGTVYLKCYRNLSYENNIELVEDYNDLDKYSSNPYSKVRYTKDSVYVTTNYRVLLENKWLNDLQYLCEPTEYHEKRISVHFITSIGIVRELLRHRKFSFSNESTRYCNYSSEKKFGGEITFIIPSYINDLKEGNYIEFWIGHEGSGGILNTGEKIKLCNTSYGFLVNTMYGQLNYLDAIKLGLKPQQARDFLPLATKSELIMTGFISDWKDLFNKRSSIASTGMPHPDMAILINPLMKEDIWKRNKENQ